jgi:membrane protein implicated in regulation of membrane protease activity
LAPRALEDSVRPRRLAGVGARPLNFTVRSQRGAVAVITLSAIVSALVLAAVGYQLIQWWDLRQSAKKIPRQPITGLSALVGADAEVVDGFKRSGPAAPALGRVRIGNELWQAELVTNLDRMAAVGDQVRVTGVAGMVVKVECR